MRKNRQGHILERTGPSVRKFSHPHVAHLPQRRGILREQAAAVCLSAYADEGIPVLQWSEGSKDLGGDGHVIHTRHIADIQVRQFEIRDEQASVRGDALHYGLVEAQRGLTATGADVILHIGKTHCGS